MPRKSKIKDLAPELQELINDLLRREVTLDEIMEKLREIGVDDISRSSVGRYRVDIAKASARMRRSREVSKALIEHFGEAPESKTARLNLELMDTAMYEFLDAVEEGKPLDPKSLAFMAKAVADVARARRTEADFILQIRREMAAEQKAKMDALAKEAGASGKRGIDPETLRRIRSEIYGLPE